MAREFFFSYFELSCVKCAYHLQYCKESGGITIITLYKLYRVLISIRVKIMSMPKGYYEIL